MTVFVVADSVPATFDAALSDVDWRLVDPPSAAATLETDPPTAVVLDWSVAADHAGALLDALRSVPDADVPVVVVADDHDADADLGPIDSLLVRPVASADLRSAVDRATLVGEYDRVVGELFDRARAEATEGDDPPEHSTELGRLRRDADAVLDELVGIGSPELLAALLAERGGPDGSRTGEGPVGG